MFGAGQRFASCCVASVILCQSLLRTVDCQSITPAFWKLLLILQTRLLGFIFTAFMICLSSTTVVFSADQVVAGGFQTLDFSMPFVFARALIDFFFSVSIQIACFSLKVSSLVFILVCVCHHRMQDSEYRSNVYNWFDSFPGFNIWRMNATGHSWSFRKTREATVLILLLTSDRGMNTKSAELSWLNIYVLNHRSTHRSTIDTDHGSSNNKMWHSVFLSHIHLLIIFVNVLTPQPTEQFCLYCSILLEGTVYIYTHIHAVVIKGLVFSCSI